jgi:phospholipid/cholesterol/gamma-HCH transport system permease protein
VVLGVESVAFVSGVAVFVGITIVVHLVFWIGLAGQSQLLGPLLVTIVVRELAPVLVSLIMIVRSGSAMATELGIMKIDGRVDALAAQEGAPLLILVLPRVLGAAVSAFCLTIVFILVAFASGYLVGALGGKGSRDPLLLATSVLGAIGPQDVLAVLGNSVVPGLYTAASCCVGGLDVGMSLAEVPRATQRALVHSVIGLFGISTIVTVLTYIG